MDPISSRVEELLGQMSPAQKAAQLTQYFFFRLPEGVDVEPALGLDVEEQPRMVEAALRAGGAGSLLFVTDPAETNRLQRLAVESEGLGIPVLFGFDVIHGLHAGLRGRAGRAALLERRRPRLGAGRVDVRRLGRRRLHRDVDDHLHGDRMTPGASGRPAVRPAAAPRPG